MEIGSPDYFTYLTAATYWSLIVCWTIILGFYVREYRRLRGLSPIIATLLVVIFIDGARTLVESLYFGTWYTARTRLIPFYLWDLLSEPQYVVMPKALNLIAALIIMSVMVRHWFADLEKELERRRRVDQLYGELQNAYRDLQQIQQARDDMTHMLVHDMRTPLTNVITSLYTLQQVGNASPEEALLDGQSPPRDPALTEQMVAAALAGSQRVLRMVNDLLDISRMEAGELVLEWHEFPIQTALAEAVRTVQALADEKSITLQVEPVPEGLVVRADPELVRRVLVNILGNAVKFTPLHGEVSASAGEKEGWVRVSITDTGPGLSAADQERVFDKFYQARRGEEAGGSAPAPSTGLGLTFCQLAVSAHGGQIGVESALGEGSKFWFTLPAANAGAAAVAAASAAPAGQA